jgi:c-di-GMP-binding flagellar brake protein YcgR
LDRRKPELERREWVRLPLAIPIFVRSKDQSGKDFLEFATALNISASGALVAVHRALRPAAQVSLEIPSAPLAASAPIPKSSRNLRAKIVRVTHADGYHLLGIKFAQPLISPPMRRATLRRKVASLV